MRGGDLSIEGAQPVTYRPAGVTDIRELSWAGDDRFVFNLGYSYRRNTTNNRNAEDFQQIDVSSYYPVSREWSVFFRALYDLASAYICPCEYHTAEGDWMCGDN